MSEFDGSTQVADPQQWPPNGNGLVPDEPDEPMGVSALEQLRGIVEELPDSEPWVKVIGAGKIRITCATVIDDPEYRRWVRAAMPKVKGRRTGAPDPTRMDQLLLCTNAVIGLCEHVEVRNARQKRPDAPDAWIKVVDPATGAALALNDAAMLATFKTPDARQLVKRLFGRDADVIANGMELLEKCGYIPGEDDDEEDPT